MEKTIFDDIFSKHSGGVIHIKNIRIFSLTVTLISIGMFNEITKGSSPFVKK